MAKRILSFALVLAMLVSLMPQVTVGVTAEGNQAPGASEWANHTGHDGWTAWGDTESEWTKLPTAEGKYYLTHDVTLSGSVTVAANVDLCLNGHQVKQTASGKRHIYLNEGSGITFSLYDCGTTGKLTGGSQATGSVINVTRTNTFKMYGGKITGNTSTGDAVVYIQAANATRPTGGVFYMYGGEISGNKCKDGVIYGAGGGETWTNSQVNIYGGTIKDNEATGSGGAIYVKSYGTLHIENATITGNKAGSAGSAIYAQNHTPITIKNSTITGNIGTSTHSNSRPNGWSAAIYTCGAGNLVTLSGKVVISGNTTAYADTADISLNYAATDKLYVNELTAGSNVTFRTMKAAAETADAVVALNGTQNAAFPVGALTYFNGTEAKLVGMENGAFKFVEGHFHDGQLYQPWTGGALNTGYYYLTGDVESSEAVTISGDVHICFNGHDIIAQTAGNRLFTVQKAGKLTLEDCSATTDASGNYVAGGLTAKAGLTMTRTYGGLINVNGGGTLNMTGGKIYGVTNTGSDGSPIYLQGASTTNGKAVFNMTGGEISGNTSKAGGAINMAGAPSTNPDTENVSELHINGGNILNNVGTNDTGAIRVGLGKVTIKNAKINGNAAPGKIAGALHVTGATSVVVVENTEFTNNSAESASVINLLSSAQLTLKDVTITGNTNGARYGAVNVSNGNATLKLEGATVIYDNLNKDSAQQNLHLQDGATIDVDVSGLTAGAKVGVSLLAARITNGLMYFSTEGMTSNPGYCISDDDTYEVKLNETSTRLELGEKTVAIPHVHKLCNDASCTAHGEGVTFLPWESNNSLPTEGSYYLTENVTLTNNITVAAGTTLNLCLNGKTITQNGSSKRVASVSGTLNLTDCATAYNGTTYAGGVIKGGSNSTGGAVLVSRGGGVFNMYGGRFAENGSTASGTSGGVIYLQSGQTGKVGAVFNMYGGELYNNTTATYGGAVTVWGETATSANGRNASPATFNMYGGKIWGNHSGMGGAVYVGRDGVFHMASGIITQNTANKAAGVMTDTDTTISVSGTAYIYDNTAATKQSNLYLTGDKTFTVGTMANGAQVGLSREESRTAEAVSANTVDAVAVAYFVSDDAETYELKHKDGYVALVEKVVAPPAEPHVHKLCNDASCTGHGADVDFQPWDSANSLPTSGNYYLTKDVDLTAVATLDGDLTLCLNGKTIKQTASNSRVFTIASGKTLTITDCQSGGTITGGAGTYGAAINVNKAGVLNLYAGKITGNQRTNSGNAEGTVYIQAANASASGAVFNMYGGEISGNKVSRGGAVSLADSGSYANPCTFNMYGGVLKDNETVVADNKGGMGAAINVSGAGVVNIQGGTISGNKAAAMGGAIYLNRNAEITIANAQITDNQSGDVGGAIRATAETKSLTISGNTVITGNKCGETTDNLHLVGTTKFTVGEMTTGAKVGLTIDAGRSDSVVSTNTVDASALTFFVSDAVDDFEVTQKNGYLAMVVKLPTVSEHMHKACNDAACSDHATVPYVKWESDNSLPTAGNYYLTKDVQLSAAASVTGELNLCLNGHTVTAAEGKRVITVAKNGGLLNLTDCNQNPGALTGGTGTWGAAVNINAGTTFNMFGGKITGNQNVSASGGVGAIYVQGAGSTFNMYGGEISGNEGVLGIIYSPNGITGDPMQINLYGGVICNNKTIKNGTAGGNGGAITAYGNTLVTIDGGKICNNEAEGNGGGLFVNGKDAVVTMNSGLISGNKATNGGGMLFQTRSKLILNGGEISGNEVTGGGGGFYTSNTTELEMNGGLITGNKAGGSGAGFFCFRSTATINGGEVIGNEATNRAGGVAIQGAKAEIKKITVKGNSAKQGGAFYINRGTYESNGETVYEPAIVNIYDGVLITENKAQKECGGLLMANDEVVVTMLGGEISKNKAENGAGAMTWKGATFVMKGGKITGNTTGQYGGVYISNDSTFKMEGGTISNNTSKGGSGVYFYRSTGVLSGGTISGNYAKYEIKYTNGKETKSGGNGGAIYVNGSKVTLSGTNLTNNTADGNGGAVVTGRYTLTTNGVKTYIASTLTMTGGTISGNKATNAGGILTQTDTVFHFRGGLVTKNEATAGGGGIYISTKSTMHMTGGRVVNNYAEKQGGGIYCLKSTVNITGGEINNNTSGTNSGNMMVNGDVCVVNVKNMKIYGGASNTAGAIVVQSKGTLNMENCDIYGNKTIVSHGGAVYVSNKSFGNFTNCRFFENESVNLGGAVLVNNFGNANFKNCEFYDNAAAKQGGAVWCSVASKTTMEGCSFTNNTAGERGGAITCKGDMVMTNCLVEGNTAGAEGGGIYTDVNTTTGSGLMKGLELHNTQIKNNTAANQGGGMFIYKGCKVKLYDTEITGNKSGAEGGAMWVYEDLELHGATITGNTSGGEGYAVYMNDANYDGHSYFTSRNKMSGDVIIKDNQGGDLWMGPDVVFVVAAAGLGEKTHIELTMDSGVLTNRILGAYHYEGGDQVYTVTYGDRSMTDPEYDASLVPSADAQQTKEGESTDAILYAGIGVFVAAIIAVAAVLIAKKKKAGKPAEEATKE